MADEDNPVLGVRVTVLSEEDAMSFSFDTGPGAPPVALIRAAAPEDGDRSRADVFLDVYAQWPQVHDVAGLADALEEIAQLLREGAEGEE